MSFIVSMSLSCTVADFNRLHLHVFVAPVGGDPVQISRRSLALKNYTVFSARCNIYICYDVSVRLSVRLSVTEVHWRIIANLGFKFRSKFTAHCGRGACGR